ncbi:SPATS2-like protein [Mixophyes fleayi]|uniref:SPATS2-like protein n=1 Tax=Mixophyes fleayi TaxID=3061075 RepID=UPI003F4DCD19
MEQPNWSTSSNDKVQKRRRSKGKYGNEDSSSKNKPAVMHSPGNRQLSASSISGYKRDVVFEESKKDQGTVKKVVEKSMMENKVKSQPDIPGLNTEKSAKDLQRCSVSLTRYRLMIKEEVETSVRNIKTTFAELYKSIMDRETQMILEAEKIKQDALEALTARQRKAEELRRIVNLSSQRPDTEMSDLRAQIKNFVSERKYDEDLSRSARIDCDAVELKKQILKCGEISHPENNYSTRTVSKSASSHVVQIGRAAKSKLHWQHRRNASNQSKACTGDITDTEAVSDNPTKLQDPARSFKQYGNFPLHQHRRFVSRRVGQRGENKPFKVEEGEDIVDNPVSRCERVNEQQNSFKNRSRRRSRNKELVAPQSNSLQHCEQQLEAKPAVKNNDSSTDHIT